MASVCQRRESLQQCGKNAINGRKLKNQAGKRRIFLRLPRVFWGLSASWIIRKVDIELASVFCRSDDLAPSEFDAESVICYDLQENGSSD